VDDDTRLPDVAALELSYLCEAFSSIDVIAYTAVTEKKDADSSPRSLCYQLESDAKLASHESESLCPNFKYDSPLGVTATIWTVESSIESD